LLYNSIISYFKYELRHLSLLQFIIKLIRAITFGCLRSVPIVQLCLLFVSNAFGAGIFLWCRPYTDNVRNVMVIGVYILKCVYSLLFVPFLFNSASTGLEILI